MTKATNDLTADRERHLRHAVDAARHVADIADCRRGSRCRRRLPRRRDPRFGRQGLLAALLPRRFGGAVLGGPQGAAALAKVLQLLGGASLALDGFTRGTLMRWLSRGLRTRGAARFMRRGRARAIFSPFGIRSARTAYGSSKAAMGSSVDGAKIFASGVGFIAYPLITARTGSGDLLMVVADGKLTTSDLSQWRAHGMRASASGKVNFSGIEVTSDSIIGGPDDFHRQPMFSIGAWRFAAVQLGGIAALCDVPATTSSAPGGATIRSS